MLLSLVLTFSNRTMLSFQQVTIQQKSFGLPGYHTLHAGEYLHLPTEMNAVDHINTAIHKAKTVCW